VVKFLFTILIIYVVWNAFKYRARIAAAHRAVMEQKAREEAAQQRRARSREVVAQDLVPCPKCGAYIAAGTACTCEKTG
jgi:ribosomal protein L32